MKIAKWDEFQGYRKRGPEWIKLYTGLIDRPEWVRLPLVARAVLPVLWIAASRAGNDGELPDDFAMLSLLCHLSQAEIVQALPSLISAGFILCDKTVADSATKLSQELRQNRRERREEKRERREREDLQVLNPPPPPLGVGNSTTAPTPRTETAERSGGGKAQTVPEVEEARAELVAAINTARARRPELAGMSREEILDRPEYHAPSGRVRLDSPNARLLRVTAAKLRGETPKRKATAPGWDLLPEDPVTKAMADAGRAWLGEHWPEDSDPTTWDDVLSLTACLEPPAELRDGIIAVLRFERYPDVFHASEVAA